LTTAPRRSRTLAALALSLPLSLLAAACSPLRTFNAVMPADPGTRVVLRGASFGPDKRQALDLYAPARKGSAPLPVIVFLYGGSWNSGLREGYGFAGRALAAQGFVVAVPDYRLVPQVRYPAFIEDGAAAVRWVRAHAADYGGDPERVVLMGHSAGAYNAAMLAYDARWLGAQRPWLKGFIGLAGPYDFLPLSGPATQAAFGAADDLPATQPVNHITPGGPPALLLTAANDTTVGPRNATSMAAALGHAGIAVERQTYPGIAHIGILTALARPLRGRAPVLADAAAFAHKVTAPQ
jgi:acetyl esterase/lipase